MTRIDDLLIAAVKAVGAKPADSEPQATKKNWSQNLSNALAQALAEELRLRGMKEARPAPPGTVGLSGAERRLAGGIGAKKVDVSWATDESGLIFACSVKTISFKDGATGNYQKNLTNRRGDLTVEAVTLHRRFPYAVLSGWLFIDIGAKRDGTKSRKSTFENAFPRLRLFTGRKDPSGREEQFERLYLLTLDPNPFSPSIECYHVADNGKPIPLEQAMDELVDLLGERNFDLYESENGEVRKI